MTARVENVTIHDPSEAFRTGMRKPTYFKRYCMELDLRQSRPPAELPRAVRLIAWHPGLLDAHAAAKHRSFAGETDSLVFPSLGHLSGCRELMLAIAGNPGFCAGATWLAEAGDEFVGTVQGLITPNRCGGIQNLGVAPEHRGQGIGRVLLLRALSGFARAGIRRAYLEVTARNAGALRMYRELGFRCVRTIYREVAVETAAPAPADLAVGVGI